MSLESADRFLKAVAHSQPLREKLEVAGSPEEFLSVSHRLGYCFTTAELQKIVADFSSNTQLRRPTGVGKWLRSQHWV